MMEMYGMFTAKYLQISPITMQIQNYLWLKIREISRKQYLIFMQWTVKTAIK